MAVSLDYTWDMVSGESINLVVNVSHSDNSTVSPTAAHVSLYDSNGYPAVSAATMTIVDGAPAQCIYVFGPTYPGCFKAVFVVADSSQVWAFTGTVAVHEVP